MCGIVGVVHADRSRPVDGDRLARMRDLMTHRGPDDAGAYLSGPVGLGHRRLSIIDLASGHQPMSNEEGSLRIVFNGEIYNYRELRARLLARGHRFRTASDTEVILHLYAEEGAQCVRSLNGIFAFAIWDAKAQALFLARDHMGVKPLYYAMTDEAFVFASEAKSIIGSGYVEARCREECVFEYFVFRHVSGENTLLEGVQCLLPAHTLLVKDNRVRIDRYWSPLPASAPAPIGFDRAVEELSSLVQDAVNMQLVSDVPLGTFCSGGIDSSLVTALAARAVSQPINTFSVGFHEADFDETRFARLVSARYGTVHHEVRIDNREFADLLPRLVWHQDAPLNFANSVQIYALSKLAKSLVTVVLTGEGADELFCGYPRYLIPSCSAAYRRLPGLLRRLAREGARLAGDHRVGKIDGDSRRSAADTLLYNSGFLAPELVHRVLTTGSEEHPSYRESCLREDEASGLDVVTRLALMDQRNYLVSILERQDKMSMAASIESRVPFLDFRVVEFANRLPVSYKVRGLQTKSVLKRVARRYLPREVVTRRKSGFGVPLRAWLADEKGLGRYVDELLDSRDLDPYLRRQGLVDMIGQHRSGQADHSEFLWTAANFMIWLKSIRAGVGA